jgi:hypothetical protein
MRRAIRGGRNIYLQLPRTGGFAFKSKKSPILGKAGGRKASLSPLFLFAPFLAARAKSKFL